MLFAIMPCTMYVDYTQCTHSISYLPRTNVNVSDKMFAFASAFKR